MINKKEYSLLKWISDLDNQDTFFLQDGIFKNGIFYNVPYREQNTEEKIEKLKLMPENKFFSKEEYENLFQKLYEKHLIEEISENNSQDKFNTITLTKKGYDKIINFRERKWSRNIKITYTIITILLLITIVTSKLLIDSYKRIGDIYYKTYTLAFGVEIGSGVIPLLNDADFDEYDASLLYSKYGNFISNVGCALSSDKKYEYALCEFTDELSRLSIMMRRYDYDSIHVIEAKENVIDKAKQLRELYKELEEVNGDNKLKWYFFFN